MPNWKHPVSVAVVGAIAAALLGAGGYLIKRYLLDVDRTDLRFEVQGVSQAIDLLSETQPSLDGETIYCDTLGLTLMLAHNQGGTRPILVHNLRLDVEPVPVEDATLRALDCEVDALASRPYGIIETQAYVFTLKDEGYTGRFLESRQRGDVKSVEPAHILGSGAEKTVLTLQPNEAPTALTMFIETQSPGLFRMRFHAAYDARGEKTAATHPLLIAKVPN